MSVRKRVKRTVEGSQAPSGGESVSEWLERDDHPLSNDLILDTLFGFVRRFDLKSSRGVSKKWNIHTIPHMRSHFKVIIHGSDSDNKVKRNRRRIDNFIKLFRKNEMGIPFGKFTLGAFPTTDEVGQQFLQLCGEIATEIDLNGWEEYIIEDVSELLRSCPNLKVFGSPSHVITCSGRIVKLFPDSTPTFKYLKKIAFRLDCKERLEYCPTFIEELISASPNIVHIVSDTFQEYENEEGSTVSVVLTEIEKLGTQSSIQTLNLCDAEIEDIEYLEKMAKNGFKLRNLSFEPHETDDDDLDRIQIQLATIFKDTLQHLDVEAGTENILTEYPKMPNLKFFSLHGFLSSDPKPVNLNENFPALETLNIGFEVFSRVDQFFSQFLPCPTVKSLIVDHGLMTIHTFNNIQRAFPNLIKLELEFMEDGFEILRRIWSQMTGLESLGIRGVVSIAEELELDSLFTGISTKTLRRIHPIVNGLDIMTVEKRKERISKLRSDHCRLPSIGNLTKLKHLKLSLTLTATGETNNQRKQSLRSFARRKMRNRVTYRLTDLTGYLALYPLNHLNHIEVRNCTFTKTCCGILTKETGLESWNFRKERFGEVIIPSFVCREKEKEYI